MAYFENDPFAMPSRRHTFAGGQPLNRSSRSWTDNDIHYTVESTSYASPNFAFGIVSKVMGNRVTQTTWSPRGVLH